MRIQLNRRRSITIVTSIMSGLVMVGAGVFVTFSMQRLSYADIVPESCFVMDGSDPGKIVEYNPNSDPLCVSDVTIPATIGGNTVTTIGAGIFSDDIVSSVVVPNTITVIESGAFSAPGVTLTALAINVPGNLTIGSGALGQGVTGTVTIHAGGNLIYNESGTGALTSLTIDAGGSITMPTSASGTASIDTLSITAGSDISITAGAFSETTLGNVVLHSDTNIAIGGGAFASQIASINIHAEQALSIAASMYVSSEPRLSMQSISFEAGTTMNLSSNTLYKLESVANLSLTTHTGLMTIANSALCDINDLDSITISAPVGLTVVGGAFCDMPDLTSVNFVQSGGDISIAGFSGLALEELTLATDGSITITDGAFGNSPTLSSLNLSSDDTITITNGSFSNMSALSSVNLTAGDDITVTNGALTTSPALDSLAITTPKSITLTYGAFATTSATNITIDAGTDVTISQGGLSTTSNLENLSVEAGNALIIEAAFYDGEITEAQQPVAISLYAGGHLEVISGAFGDTYARSVTIASGGTMSLTSGAFYSLTTPSLTIQSAGDLTITESAFRGLSGISHLTLPASLVSLDFGAFGYSQLQSVTLLSTPTIGEGVFCGSGVGYDAFNGTYTDFDKIYYLQVYAPTGTSLTDTLCPPEDLNGESIEHAMGGYVVNPAQVKVQYKDDADTILSSEPTIVGRLTDGTPLENYLVSENPTGNLSLYYHLGDTLAFAAPDLDGYITPTARTVVLGSGLNTVNFIYTTLRPTMPNTGILGQSIPKKETSLTESFAVTLLAVSAAVAVIAITLLATLRTRARRS